MYCTISLQQVVCSPCRSAVINQIHHNHFCSQSYFYWYSCQRKPAAALDGVQSLPAGQRASAGDVLHAAAVWNQTLLGHHVIEVAGVELGEAILLGNMDL